MRQRFDIVLGALLIALTSATSLANAESSSPYQFRAVVELFTSQGCSSCPPADRLLKTYVDRKDVLALSFPVDYWDYLGWKDTYASPMHSQRQRRYAITRGDGAVYTPQAVVNGAVHMNGSSKNQIDQAIDLASRKNNPLFVPVKISREGRNITVTTGPMEARYDRSPIGGTVWLAMVQRQGVVPVRNGENGGKELAYHNIVRRISPIGMWGGEEKSFQVIEDSVSGMPEATACAVLIQQGTTGPIVGAAWLNSAKSAQAN